MRSNKDNIEQAVLAIDVVSKESELTIDLKIATLLDPYIHSINLQ